MSLPLAYRVAAQLEFENAAVWYEERLVGLGGAFICEVQKVLDKIVKQPDRYPVVTADVREAPVRRFPYCVYLSSKVEPDRDYRGFSLVA